MAMSATCETVNREVWLFEPADIRCLLPVLREFAKSFSNVNNDSRTINVVRRLPIVRGIAHLMVHSASDVCRYQIYQNRAVLFS
jgi:hypothetical protein